MASPPSPPSQSAQAYVESLAASMDSPAPQSSALQQQAAVSAAPTVLPLTADSLAAANAIAETLDMGGAAAAAAAAPAGAMDSSGLAPAAAVLPMAAGLVPAAPLAALPTAAMAVPASAMLTPSAAAAQLAAAAGGAVSPPTALVTPATAANLAAASAAAVYNPATPALAPVSLAASGLPAGLSAATALMPTGATPAQIAGGMPAMLAVQVAVPSSTPQGAPVSTASSASTVSAASEQQALAQQALTQQFAGLMAAQAQVQAAQAQVQAQVQAVQQAQAQAQQAAAVSAGLSAMLPTRDDSQLSLASLKSASVASSLLSTVSPPALLQPSGGSASASTLASGATGSSSVSKKVRVLLSSGGQYEELSSGSSGDGGGKGGRWRYVGGETRLVGLCRTTSFSSFLQLLSKATSAVWDESCRLMYDLPSAESEGGGGTLVDLIDDEDLEMMWEEMDAVLATRPGFRLHMYAQLGGKRGSTGDSSGCGSADGSHAATKELGSCDTAGGGKGTPGSTPPVSGGTGVSAITAAAEAAAAAAAGSGSSTALTASEFEDLMGDVVSDSPQMALSDLESKLELIRPEDLTPVRLLGTGGFGEVYLCRWHSCDVAVKCLNPQLLVPDGKMGSISKESVSELLKEASMLGSVRHPNVVWVYGLVLPPLEALSPALEAVRAHLPPGQGIDAVKVATQMANKHRAEAPSSQVRPPALVTEYLASGSLRAAIARRADFLSRDSVRIKLALDAARGMDYLHAKGIVHFDLKTANLLVGMRDKTPVCKVADFGLSKQKQQTFVSGVASLRGTLPWIAPEIIKTPSQVTEACDTWSFGVVLWELWALREPFEGINYHALLHMMSSSEQPLCPPLPGSPEFEGDPGPEPATGWGGLIAECWQGTPAARPTFRQIVSRLENMLRANRMAKRRTASGPALASGNPGVAGSSVG